MFKMGWASLAEAGKLFTERRTNVALINTTQYELLMLYEPYLSSPILQLQQMGRFFSDSCNIQLLPQHPSNLNR
jgi:hypothetical protein